jgi:hypothetical protein
MRFVLPPLLVAALALQAAGSFGGALFCRTLGERLSECCCPDDEVRPSGPELSSAGCCDVLRGTAPESVAQERVPAMGKAPARSTVPVDVALPGPSLGGGLAVRAGFSPAMGASGPPGQAPVFLSLKQLLI